MNVKLFQSDNDLGQINSWLREHGQVELKREDVPSCGLIVDRVASCFLYKSECGTCYIEYMITNPAAASHDRNEAMYLIIRGLIEIARECGMKRIIGITRHPSLADRISTCGFFPIAGNCYALTFEEAK